MSDIQPFDKLRAGVQGLTGKTSGKGQVEGGRQGSGGMLCHCEAGNVLSLRGRGCFVIARQGVFCHCEAGDGLSLRGSGCFVIARRSPAEAISRAGARDRFAQIPLAMTGVWVTLAMTGVWVTLAMTGVWVRLAMTILPHTGTRALSFIRLWAYPRGHGRPPWDP